ncbi:MAG: hypothetical protein AAF196_02565 [Planctomycetota bacterium]
MRPILTSFLVAALASSAAFSQSPPTLRTTALYSTVHGSSSSLGPGSTSARFIGGQQAFEPLTVNAAGQWAILGATTDGPTVNVAVIRDGQIITRIDDPQPFAQSMATWNSIDDIAINGAGELAISGAISLGAQGFGAISRHTSAGPGTLSLTTGVPVGSLLPAFPFPAANIRFIGSPILTDNGVIGGRLNVMGGAPINSDHAVFLGNTVLAIEGMVPPGATAGVQLREAFRNVAASPDGSNHLVWARTNTPTGLSEVVLVNGNTVLEGNTIIPGSGFSMPIARNGLGFWEADFDGSGQWYAVGANTGPGGQAGVTWIVQNGAVIAVGDGSQEVVPGTGEVWVDFFFAFDCNSAGDRLIGGRSSAPSTSDVILARTRADGTSQVIAREGDPVDLDGNGLFDDNYFVRYFADVPGGPKLLPDGSVLAIVVLRDGTQDTLLRALCRIGESTASCAVSNGTGVNPTDLSCTTDPKLGTTWQLDIATNSNTVSTSLLLSLAPAAPFTIPGLGLNEFLLDLNHAIELPPTTTGVYDIVMPRTSARAFWDLPVYLQGIRCDSIGGTPTLTATNRIDAVLGF